MAHPICPMPWQAAPTTDTPRTDSDRPARRRASSMPPSDKSAPHSDIKRAVTLPDSKKSSSTRHSVMARACRPPSRYRAYSAAVLASPSLTPGSGTTARSGSALSTSESTSAAAVKTAHSVNV